jgi:hypothetical protein
MKKRVLVIFIFILGLLLIPRYNKSGIRSKASQGQRSSNRESGVETDELNCPFPERWLLGLINCKTIRKYKITYRTFISGGYNNNNYQPTHRTYHQYEWV